LKYQLDNKQYFNSLDGLRTLSFFLVFLTHGITIEILDKIEINNDFLKIIFKTIFSSGSQGVSIFFVLSGFLITYLIFKEEEKNKQFSLKLFYVRRTLRIWPLFYMVVLYSLFIYPIICSILEIDHLQNGDVTKNLLFLNNFGISFSKFGIYNYIPA